MHFSATVIRVITALILLLLPVACARQELLSPEEFTREFVRKLAETSAEAVVVSDLEVDVSTPGGEPARASLGHAYEQYRLLPSNKDSILSRFAEEARQGAGFAQAPVDVRRIVPVIKDRDWIEETRRQEIFRGNWNPPTYLSERFNAELLVVYAEDAPSSVRYLTEADLERAGVATESARELACENLRRILPEIESHATDGIRLLSAGGDYESSVLLLDSIWKNFAQDVDGEVVVGVPSRDLVLVAGSNDGEAIRKQREIVEQTFRSTAYPVSGKLFVWRDGEFRVFHGAKR